MKPWGANLGKDDSFLKGRVEVGQEEARKWGSRPTGKQEMEGSQGSVVKGPVWPTEKLGHHPDCHGKRRGTRVT